MGTFTVRLTSALPPAEAWRRVWDLDEHSRVIPLTRLHGDGTGGSPLGEGSRFVARTHVGPVGMDDVMQVRRFDRPEDAGSGPDEGLALVEKTGRVVRGHIDARVGPHPRGSEVVWTQKIGLLGLPAAADPVLDRVAKLAYRHVLTRLLA